MIRLKPIPAPDGPYTIQPLVMESAKENQEWSLSVPDTHELPTTHEHFVETVTDATGRTVKSIGVRRRVDVATKKPTAEPDELNKLDDPSLEVKAAELNLDTVAFKKLNKAQRVAKIREATAAKAKA